MHSITESHRTGVITSLAIAVFLTVVILILSFRDAYILAVPTAIPALYFLFLSFKYWRLHRENGSVTLILSSERLPENRDFEGELTFGMTKNFSSEIQIELQCI